MSVPHPVSGETISSKVRSRRYHSAIFWIVATLAVLDAVVLFYKTKLVDHPEFVSFPKVAVAFLIWLGLLATALYSARESLLPFWVVFAVTLVLVIPAFLQIARFLLSFGW